LLMQHQGNDSTVDSTAHSHQYFTVPAHDLILSEVKTK